MPELHTPLVFPLYCSFAARTRLEPDTCKGRGGRMATLRLMGVTAMKKDHYLLGIDFQETTSSRRTPWPRSGWCPAAHQPERPLAAKTQALLHCPNGLCRADPGHGGRITRATQSVGAGPTTKGLRDASPVPGSPTTSKSTYLAKSPLHT